MDNTDVMAPSTTPDSSMPPYNSAGAGDILGTPAAGPLQDTSSQPQPQPQPSQAANLADSVEQAAINDPELHAAAVHHGRLASAALAGANDIANFLGGSKTYKVTTDANGNPKMEQVDATQGEKWGRIAATVLAGAAKGFAAGQGPGGAAKAVGAGFDQGVQGAKAQKQQAQEDLGEAQKQMVFNANMAHLNQENFRQSWDNKHLEPDYLQKQQDFAVKHLKEMDDLGIQPILMGVKDPKTLAQYGIANPNAVGAHMGVDGAMIYNEPDGKGGSNVYQLSASQGNMRIPTSEAAELISYDPKDVTKTVSQPFTFPAGQTVKERAAQRMALNAANGNIQKGAAAAKVAQEGANTKQQEADDKSPLIKAQTAEANAKAAKDRFDMGAGAQGSDLVDSIASGHIALDRLGYIAARNPGLLAAVQQKDPSFDSSKAASYPNVYKEFTSTKPGTAGGALNAGGTALKHLKELDELNTPKSHIPGTPAHTAYINKADTVSAELAKFYGDATIPAIAAIKDTLTTTLPGNRHAAITTQAKSMGDKLDSYEQTWKNAAPSKAYEAPMPGIDQKAMDARAALDPAYHNRQVAEEQGQGGPPSGTIDVKAGGATYHFNTKAQADDFTKKAKAAGVDIQ